MHPDDSTPDKDRETFGEDAWPGLQRATEAPNANLVADIVGHPKGAPSVAELAYTNPSLDEATIRDHLDALREAGVVEVLEPARSEQEQGRSDAFYTLTDRAREAFDEHDLFPEDAWQRQYDRVEKTDTIRKLEAMSRA